LRKKSRLLLLAVTLGVHGSAGVAAAAGANEPSKDGSPPPMSEKAVCVQAFEQGQRLQKDTKYLAANQEFLKCAKPTCGDILFRECSKMYGDLQDAIPTVVFSARDAQSNSERTAVVITMDGAEILQQIDGRPMTVDPGSHHFTFTIPDRPPVEQDVVVRAGDKFRQIAVVFEAPHSEQPAPAPVSAPLVPAEESRGRSVPSATYVLGGFGLAALGVFGAFRLMGSSDYDTLDKRCSPNCSQSDVDKVRQKYTISNIAAGVGGAALAGALVVYLAAPSAKHSTALSFAPSPGGVSTRFVTHF
jgi:hypothetical protein